MATLSIPDYYGHGLSRELGQSQRVINGIQAGILEILAMPTPWQRRWERRRILQAFYRSRISRGVRRGQFIRRFGA